MKNLKNQLFSIYALETIVNLRPIVEDRAGEWWPLTVNDTETLNTCIIKQGKLFQRWPNVASN